MPEHDCLPPDVSATEFVVHMARMSGLPTTAARERTADTLRHVGLYEERYRPIGGYSTGMKQRVKLAQALVHDPQLVLLDEPTNGLDPAGRDDMLGLIRRIGTEFGISVLVASHLLGELERVCDHVVVIDAGRLLRSSSTADVTAASQLIAVEVDRAHRRARRGAARGRARCAAGGHAARGRPARRHDVRHRARHRGPPRARADPDGTPPAPDVRDLHHAATGADDGDDRTRGSSTTSATGTTTARGRAAATSRARCSWRARRAPTAWAGPPSPRSCRCCCSPRSACPRSSSWSSRP